MQKYCQFLMVGKIAICAIKVECAEATIVYSKEFLAFLLIGYAKSPKYNNNNGWNSSNKDDEV